MTRRAARALLVLACLAAAGCDDGPGAGGREVRPLEIPTAAEREASQRYDEAAALLGAGREAQAEPLLHRALELSPRHARALAALSGILIERRRFEEAERLLRVLVEVSPDDGTARQRLFDALYARRDWAAAESVARNWTRDVRDSSDAWYALGSSLHAAGRLDAAVPALRQAGTLKAARADVRSRLGLVYQAQGKLAEAEASQRDAVQRDPRCGEAWLRLADLLERRGPDRHADALGAYRRALAADAARFGFARVHVYRLLALAARRDATTSGEADAEWRTLLRVAGRDMLPWDGLGSPPPSTGDPQAEERALRDALSANPDDAPTRVRFAMLLHRRGDTASAVDEYAEAMLGDPANARLRSALGAALLVREDAAAAEPQLREALRLDPTDETTWRNLGWARLLLGRDADAIAAFDEALRRFAGDRLAQRARGLARMHAGGLDEGLREVEASGWVRP